MSEEEKDLINLKIAISPEKYIKELLEENQELKKQLKQIQQDGTSLLGINETLSRQIGMIKTQQKEFIKYLNDCIKELERESLNKLQNTINLGIRDITREILSKYKKIVGDKYEQ